jgi:hypothetical protein
MQEIKVVKKEIHKEWMCSFEGCKGLKSKQSLTRNYCSSHIAHERGVMGWGCCVKLIDGERIGQLCGDIISVNSELQICCDIHLSQEKFYNKDYVPQLTVYNIGC